MPLTYDPTQDGLEKVLRKYQIEALRLVWEEGEKGVVSREAWSHVNNVLDEEGRSRASVINFLNYMVDEGVLSYEEKSCKGGYQRVYYPAMNEREFKIYIAKMVIESFLKDFPEETREAIEELDLGY